VTSSSGIARSTCQRRSFDDFVRPLITSWEFHTHPEVGTTLHQPLGDR
jgi:hypothetical protein